MGPSPSTTAITRGLGNVMLVVEAAEPVEWALPRDIDYHAPFVPRFGGIFNGHFNAAMANGQVYFLPRFQYPDEEIRLLLQPTGKESVPAGWPPK